MPKRVPIFTITLKNGRVGRYVGPVIVEEGDIVDGSIGIDTIHVLKPFELPEHDYMVEIAPGVKAPAPVVVIEPHQVDKPTN
jgi:hypothetical protein